MMSGLPEGWVWSTLGDAANYGKAIKVEPSEVGTDEWVLELEDIEKDTSRLLQRIYNSERKTKSSKNRFKKGDVLYRKLRPYLNKVLLADNDGVCTTEIIPLSATAHVNASYLFYSLKRPDFLEYVTSISHGLNMPRLGTKAGQDALIPLPPLSEQKRIADKLDALLARVDACRERLDRVPVILKRFRQAVLAAATSGGLTEGWREADVQSIAMVGTGSTPLRSNASFYVDNGFPWITSAATGQSLVFSASEFVSDAAISAHRLKKYPVGTLLVAMYGEGKTRGQVTELAIEATINQACAAIVVDESKAARAYVKFALQANYYEMRELAEGGNQPNLNLSKIKEFLLFLPSLTEQHEIVRRVEALFAFADRLEARYNAARKQVDQLTPSLLAKAFRGELVAQEENQNITTPPTPSLKTGGGAKTSTPAPSLKTGGGAKAAPRPIL
jgi:type I restriction enzyme S subunit